MKVSLTPRNINSSKQAGSRNKPSHRTLHVFFVEASRISSNDAETQDDLRTRLNQSHAIWKVVCVHHASPPGANIGDFSLEWPFERWGANTIIRARFRHFDREKHNRTPTKCTSLSCALVSLSNPGPDGDDLQFGEATGTVRLASTRRELSLTFRPERAPNNAASLTFNVADGFSPLHFCYTRPNHELTRKLLDLKTPSPGIKLIAHRGLWGDPDYGNAPENSMLAMKIAIDSGFDALEVDVGATAQEVEGVESSRNVVALHDYWLGRLTPRDTPLPSEKDVVGNVLLEDITDLPLRQRDNTYSDTETVMSFQAFVQLVCRCDVVAKVDIKELRSDGDEGKSSHILQAYQTDAQRTESWLCIAEKCIEIADIEGAVQNLVFQPHASYNTIRRRFGKNFDRALWSPVLFDQKFSSETKQEAYTIVDQWIEGARQNLFSIELNFKTPSSPFLEPFRGCCNLIEYIVKRNVRPAIFIAEPAGCKGAVNRWGQWRIPDLTRDFRGDHFVLNSIPYFDFMQVVTDRPNFWRKM